MTQPIDRLRAATLILPDVSEGPDGTFAVDGRTFAIMAGDTLRLLSGDDAFATVALGDDADWSAIEDRVAQAWEAAAPRGLLEAGGR